MIVGPAHPKDRRVQIAIAVGTAISALIAVLVYFQTCGKAPNDPLSAQQRTELAERLRLAALDGAISVTERQALDHWLENDAARASAQAFQEAVESSLFAAAKATAEGVELITKGQRNEAMERFREALRHDPEFLDASLNLGAAELDAGQLEAARQRLELGLARVPKALFEKPVSGDEFEARLFETRIRQRFLGAYNLAGCLAALRPADVPRALSYLEDSLEAYQLWPAPTFSVKTVLADLDQSPHFRSIAANRRFQAVVEAFRALGSREDR
jgi:tetratricopeptide (TPR) repeat protein